MRKARWGAVVMVLLLVMALLAVGPAAAKPKPPQGSGLVPVSLSFVDGHDGLEAELTMRVEASRSGAVEYFADAREGSSPADMLLLGFDEHLAPGFHPGLALVDPAECGDPPYEGMTWVSFGADGELEAVMWHFDMHVGRTAGQQGKKPTCSWDVYERYTIRSLAGNELLPGEDPLRFEGGTVSGTFKLHFYDADAPEPHVDLGRTFMQFRLSIGE